ncbi:MAG: hypothetical protein M3461_19550 [Pseudomonadota bacterium]|nr:hypothetical protein [Pseudomonadota bacterium]
MRATLDLDDDVLQAARALSRRRGKPIGVVNGLYELSCHSDELLGRSLFRWRLAPEEFDEQIPILVFKLVVFKLAPSIVRAFLPMSECLPK